MKKLLYFAAMLLCFAACEDKNEQETPAKPEMTELEQTAYQMQVILNSYSNYDVAKVKETLSEKEWKMWSYLKYDSTWTELLSDDYAFGEMNATGLSPDIYQLSFGRKAFHQHSEVTEEGPEWVTDEGEWSFDPEKKSLTLLEKSFRLEALSADMMVLQEERILADPLSGETEPSFFRLVYLLERDFSGMIWDFTNYSVFVSVVDKKTGADLLNPDTEGNILGNEIQALYQGECYPRWEEGLMDFLPKDATRENLPMPLGLRWGRQSNDANALYYLSFGEFAPEDYHDEPFTIDWGDGTQTKFQFDCYTTWESLTEPVVHRNLWVDGVEQGKNWTITIEKEATNDFWPPEIQELMEQGEEQMAELLERSGDYDPERVTEMLCGKDFFQWAYLGYDSTWTEIISPMYVFGEMIIDGYTADRYRFESDGAVVWTPGKACDPEIIIEPKSGRWEFDPATRTLSLLYEGETEREDYTLIALDESSFAWDQERIFYKNDGSEYSRDYLRSVYIAL